MSVRLHPDGLNAQLQQRLHFSDDDLVANARGLLTPRQADHIRRGRGCTRAFGCLAAAFSLPMAFGLLTSSAFSLWIFRDASLLLMTGLGLLLLVVCGYLLAVGARMRAPEALAVQQVEGPARVRIDAVSDSLWKGRVTINGVTFRTSSYAARLFRAGVRFRVYYVQSGWLALLLSAEALD